MIFKDTKQPSILRLTLRPIFMWLATLAPSAVALFLLVTIFHVDLTLWANKLGAPMWFAHNRWVLVLGCIYFCLSGPVLIYLFFGSTIIELNKRVKKVTVTKSARFAKSFELNIADIKEAKYTSESCSRGGRSYSDVFVLNNGEMKNIDAGKGRFEAAKLCRLINEYLGLKPDA